MKTCLDEGKMMIKLKIELSHSYGDIPTTDISATSFVINWPMGFFDIPYTDTCGGEDETK